MSDKELDGQTEVPLLREIGERLGNNAVDRDPESIAGLLAQLFTKMAADPATQTTLAAIAAKLPASLGIKTAAGSLSVVPASDSIFTTNATSGVFNVAGTTLVRPANVTTYTPGDSISDNATAGSVTALSVSVADLNDAPVIINELAITSTDTGLGAASAQVRVHIFNSDPTLSSGVAAGDNAAYSNKLAGWIGSFSGTMRPFADGSKGVLVPDEGSVRICNPESGGKRLWFQFQTLTGFIPSVNSTTLIARFKGWYARAVA